MTYSKTFCGCLNTTKLFVIKHFVVVKLQKIDFSNKSSLWHAFVDYNWINILILLIVWYNVKINVADKIIPNELCLILCNCGFCCRCILDKITVIFINIYMNKPRNLFVFFNLLCTNWSCLISSRIFTTVGGATRPGRPAALLFRLWYGVIGTGSVI